ncbi:hypothetical protein [Chitinimonas sp.]|uniref:hypothetical protein n=1 Tax=Chitinimonas sp. TaxID=1934313 RepID=UPI0035B24969
MKKYLSYLCLTLFSTSIVIAADNINISDMYRADQTSRAATNIDWVKLADQDAKRREKVGLLLRQGKVRTAADFFRAALIFQHGTSTTDIRMAVSLSNISYSLAEGDERLKAGRLLAASWDRLMMQLKRPQWYGTQYQKIGPDGQWELYRVDETVTDMDRQKLGVPSLSEAKTKVLEMNKSADQ